MSCLPFCRVEFPGGTLACAYGALLLLHGAARFCEVQHLPLYRFGIHPAPKARPFSKGLLSCHARLFGVMRGGS